MKNSIIGVRGVFVEGMVKYDDGKFLLLMYFVIELNNFLAGTEFIVCFVIQI